MRAALVAGVRAGVAAACASNPAAAPPAAPAVAPTPGASTTSAAMAAPPPTRDDGRLPPTATPLKYAVTLDVDPSQERFTGQVTIDLDVPAPTAFIVLNGRDLAIKTATATIGAVALAGTTTVRVSHGGVAPEEIVVAFPQPLPAGRGSLVVSYDAPFREVSSRGSTASTRTGASTPSRSSRRRPRGVLFLASTSPPPRPRSISRLGPRRG